MEESTIIGESTINDHFQYVNLLERSTSSRDTEASDGVPSLRRFSWGPRGSHRGERKDWNKDMSRKHLLMMVNI